MNLPRTPDVEVETRASSLLMDVFIRAGLVLALAVLCLWVFAPFLTLMVWAVILAVTLYPLHQWIARKMGGKNGLAATLLAVLAIALIVAPTALLMSSLGDSVHRLVNDVQNNTLEIPAPPASVAGWPVVGERVHAVWSQAHTDLPALVKSISRSSASWRRAALGFVAGIGFGLLLFVAAFIVAGHHHGLRRRGGAQQPCHLQSHLRRSEGRRIHEAGHRNDTRRRAGRRRRRVHPGHHRRPLPADRGRALGRRSGRHRSRARNRPGAGADRHVPAIIYIWWSGEHGTGAAVLYSVLLFVAGMTDNVLKPLMLGRGVEAPMPVILLGALGGMAAAGILGMFVGATLLALGYQILMGWVAANPEVTRPRQELDRPTAS